MSWLLADWEKDIQAQIQLTLTARIASIYVSGGRLMPTKRAVQVFVLISALMMIVGSFVAASAPPNFIRIVLGPSSMEPESLPAGAGRNSFFLDRGGLGAVEARRLNAAIPFAGDAGVAAQPFLSANSPTDRDRAVDCLAIAAMAEAGDSDDGQRAVIQVILNRVRHPAFAKTVCGVVFEGSHRSTGCQFTFTCDGALARQHSRAAWSRARARAIEALEGRVFVAVGAATHYHTDWVHPDWSAALIKLARVDTHLFFRWPGYRGSPAFSNVAYRGGEPAIRQLAYLSAHADYAQVAPPREFDTGDDIASIDVVVRNDDGGAFVLLAGAPSAEQAREIGRGVCASRPSCKVFGWFDRGSIPSGYPVPPSSRAEIGFSYFRNSANDETTLYDCSRFSSVANDKCLPRPARSRQQLQANAATGAAMQNARAVTTQDRPAKLAGASLPT